MSRIDDSRTKNQFRNLLLHSLEEKLPTIELKSPLFQSISAVPVHVLAPILRNVAGTHHRTFIAGRIRDPVQDLVHPVQTTEKPHLAGLVHFVLGL